MARTAVIVVPRYRHYVTDQPAPETPDVPGVPNIPAVPSGPSGLQSAAPPVSARILAVAAIILSGVCGGLIGYAVTDLQCDDDCPWLATGIGSAAAILAAIGVAIVAVLTLRAMAEWNAQEIADDLAKQAS